MEYLDLSTYEYRSFAIPMRAVGWLGLEYGVQGVRAPMPDVELRRLTDASRRLGSVTLGIHECDFCPGGSAFEGNGEYRYYVRSGEVYSAPMMLLHYVKEHGYHPPAAFLEDLKEVGGLMWDWRAERLSRALIDESEDFDFRCEAIIDIANWKDPRALQALINAASDDELVDVAGDEIGQSLGLLLSDDPTSRICADDLPQSVRLGIDQGIR